MPDLTTSLEAPETSVERCNPWREPTRNSRRYIAAALMASNEELHQKWAGRISSCCTVPHVYLDTENRLPMIVPGRCRHRLCPSCQRQRAKAVLAHVYQLVRRFDAPRFITLTLVADERSPKERIRHLLDSFRRLRQRSAWKQRVRSAVATVEVTPGPEGRSFHVHLHILADGEYFPQAMLSNEWHAATETSFVVDVRKVPDRLKAARYIAAYVAKSSDASNWPAERIPELADAMNGVRCLITTGHAHGQPFRQAWWLEERPASRPLCRLDALSHYARIGNPEAQRALRLVAIIGGAWASFLGVDPADSDGRPCTAAEYEELADICVFIGCIDHDRRRSDE